MFRRSLIIATLALAAFALFATFGTSDDAEAGAPSHVASAFGRAVVNGQEVFLHVTVASVSAGDAHAAAQAALRNRGAVPVQSSEFTRNGTWDVSPDANGEIVVTLYYDSSAQPAEQNYSNSIADSAWTGVNTSSFKFGWANEPGDCPSLVPECSVDGSQDFNELNEAGWADLGGLVDGSITLGVTWFNFRTRGGPFAAPQETDFVLNYNPAIQWGSYPDGPTAWPQIDTITVAAHELGHVAGLGHSRDFLALMYAQYQGSRSHLDPDSIPLLGDDDIEGISSLYPASGGEEDPADVPGYCKRHSERDGCPPQQ